MKKSMLMSAAALSLLSTEFGSQSSLLTHSTGGGYSKSPKKVKLNNKQKKIRNKNKAAKKARKKNR